MVSPAAEKQRDGAEAGCGGGQPMRQPCVDAPPAMLADCDSAAMDAGGDDARMHKTPVDVKAKHKRRESKSGGGGGDESAMRQLHGGKERRRRSADEIASALDESVVVLKVKLSNKKGKAKRCLFAAAAESEGGVDQPLATSTPLKALSKRRRTIEEDCERAAGWTTPKPEKAKKKKMKQESEHVGASLLAKAESPAEAPDTSAKRKKRKKDKMWVKQEEECAKDSPPVDMFTTPAEKQREKARKKGKGAKREPAGGEEQCAGDTGGKPPLPYVVEIGNQRRLTVGEYKSRIVVNVRQFYMDDEGELKPGLKGLALTVSQWRLLSANAAAVDKLLDDCGV